MIMQAERLRVPCVDMQRTPKEDIWSFVYSNFFGLAVYYANIFSRCIKRPEDIEDIRNELLYGMVDVYSRHKDKPAFELKKMMKTVPRNYYKKLTAKEYDEKLRLDDVINAEEKGTWHEVVVSNVERFEHLYDYYFEKFLAENYQLNDSDQGKVLKAILYPSAEFQDFLEGEKKQGGVSYSVVCKYFRQKHKWTRNYFEQVFGKIKDYLNDDFNN